MIIDEEGMITVHRKFILRKTFDRVITTPGTFDHLWSSPIPIKPGLNKADVNYYYEQLDGDYPEHWYCGGNWIDECTHYANKYYGD